MAVLRTGGCYFSEGREGGREGGRESVSECCFFFHPHFYLVFECARLELCNGNARVSHIDLRSLCVRVSVSVCVCECVRV